MSEPEKTINFTETHEVKGHTLHFGFGHGLFYLRENQHQAGWTVGQAQKWLDREIPTGAACPVCDRQNKVYKRRLHPSMARMLIALYSLNPVTQEGYTSINDITNKAELSHPGDFSKLAWWGLVESAPCNWSKDKKSSGHWRITPKGTDFVWRRISVSNYIVEFQGRCIVSSDGQITIDQALGNKFSYSSLFGVFNVEVGKV